MRFEIVEGPDVSAHNSMLGAITPGIEGMGRPAHRHFFGGQDSLGALDLPEQPGSAGGRLPGPGRFYT